MLQKIYISFLFLAVVFGLTINYGIGVSCDEVHQIYQWRQFCLRGIITGGILIIFPFIIKPKIIVSIIEFSIIAVCTVESVYSLLQLYGVLPSMHSIFKVTGSFYNPGPLGGFIAIAIPITLHNIFVFHNKTAKYILYTALIINIIALPSTMSRTAWIAAGISTIYVLFGNGKLVGVRAALPAPIKRHPRIFIIIFTFSMLIGAFFLWHIKHDSAVGRLLLWKISALAIADAPFLGNGNFASAYGAAQEKYFANNDATISEKLAAGSPDYAFNEYLQIGVEYGLLVLFFELVILGLIIRKSYREKSLGLSGSLIAIMVFAFASYPLHLPVFVAVVILLIFGIIINNSHKAFAILIPVAVILFSSFNLSSLNQKSTNVSSWTRMQILYKNKCYGDVINRYSSIYDAMNWNPRFLYEYGHSLYKSKKYDAAIPVLERAANISADPMPLNILGECHQALQQYETAESYYRRAANRIPSRLYPHYLLYFLYCDTGNDSLRRIEYEKVMKMTIKTESPATRDLRRLVEERECSIKNNDADGDE
ncbi:MAG: O-antigen ligase family protein [Bacteroidales bacterium]|nr:O-antigen ligase family protein [Bacteroidales bacterium]